MLILIEKHFKTGVKITIFMLLLVLLLIFAGILEGLGIVRLLPELEKENNNLQ